jgi:DNA polymerase-3 subunit gamma/tau
MPNNLDFGDWYIKFAPHTFDEVYGQDIIVNYFKGKIKTNTWDKSTLFQGNFGSGKTVLAKILAKHIACKNKDINGNPCNTCPTCNAIDKETFDRDVIYLNGEQMSAGQIDSILDATLSAPAIRDAAKVFIVDETQGLSPAAVQRFLSATQSPKNKVFFIFTAMSKLQGKNPGALQSRCKQWKMKVPTNDEIYLYLASIAKTHELIKDASVPKEFWGDGLKFLAENSESSFRKALQMLQQCYEGKIFDIKTIRETFDIVSYDNAAGILADIANGKINKRIWDSILGDDYQDKFGLISKIMGDASTIRAFGNKYIEDSEKWKWSNPQAIANGHYFEELRSAILKLGERAYIRRGDWQMVMSSIIEKIKQPFPLGLNEREIIPIVKRRQIKS